MLDGIREVMVSKPRSLVLTGAGFRSPERVLALRQVLQLGTEGTLIGDLPTKHRIPAIHGEGAFLWEPLSRALQIDETGFLNGKRIFDPADQSLDVLSVRYLVVHGHAGEFLLMERWVGKLPGVRVVRRGADLLLERPTAFPVSFLAGEVICTADAERLVHTRTYDLSSSALVACDEGKDAQTVAAPGKAEIERFEPGRVVIGVEAEGPSSAFLVVSQPDYPGWSATVGGEPARILRANGLVQGVWVPPGRHRVELEYRPPSFRVGLALSSLALLALVLASIRHNTSKDKVIST
jgi:hypothetical protein